MSMMTVSLRGHKILHKTFSDSQSRLFTGWLPNHWRNNTIRTSDICLLQRL